MRLLVLIALKVFRLYLNKMRYEMGSQCSFLKKESDMDCSIKYKNNSTKGILNLLEISHIIFTYAIE